MEYIPVIDGIVHGAEQFLDGIYSWKRRDTAEQSSFHGQNRFLEKTGCCRAEQFPWIEQIPGKDGMLQSRAVPGQSRFLEKTGCCRTEQFLDRKIPVKDWMLQSRAVPGQKDSWQRQDATEQSSSWIVQISGKDGMMQSRAVPGQSRFLEKTGCCRAEQFLDSLDFWKRRDAAEQSSSQIVQISGKDGMLQSRAVSGQKDTCKRLDAAEQSGSWIERFLAKTGCSRAEQFLDSLDFRIRRNAAEQSSSWIVQISGKDGMLQSRAVPGQSRFLEKTGCCRAEEFRDRMDSWKRRDAADQSSSQIEQIPGKDRIATEQKRSWSKVICGRERKTPLLS